MATRHNKSQQGPARARLHLRLALVAGFFAAAFLGLASRLIYLQVLHHEQYTDKALQLSQRVIYKEPRRGDIRDVHGRVLATSRLRKKISANPSLLGPYAQAVAESLAPLLRYSVDDLSRRLQPSFVTNQDGKTRARQYVNLHRKLSLEEWARLTNTLSHLQFPAEKTRLTRDQRQFYTSLRSRGIVGEEIQDRLYPNGPVAAHVLGFTHAKEYESTNYSFQELEGITGIEHALQRFLAGARGWHATEFDSKSREVLTRREQFVEPQPGLNLDLTLDLVVQTIVEKELEAAMVEFKPQSASAVVVRPRTGEILAMASAPDFDPNQPGASEVAHWKNRIITDRMEPGSTFKIVVIAAALNEGLVTLENSVDCENGMWYYKGRPLRDVHHHGILSVRQILTKSSNIGAAKVGLKLGEQRLHDYILRFGFGAPTGICLGGEEKGTVHPVAKWNGLDITRIPMGHSIDVTHLQMAMAMSAIANQGWLMRPMLVRRIWDAEGNLFAEYPPQPARQVIRPAAALAVVDALKSVVLEGTGVKARIEYYAIAGKTGTADIPCPGGYLKDKSIHSFIGFLPADQPEICISVVLDRPEIGRFAGSTAAPTFRQIAEQTARHLRLRPDLPLAQMPPTQSKSTADGLYAARAMPSE